MTETRRCFRGFGETTGGCRRVAEGTLMVGLFVSGVPGGKQDSGGHGGGV